MASLMTVAACAAALLVIRFSSLCAIFKELVAVFARVSDLVKNVLQLPRRNDVVHHAMINGNAQMFLFHKFADTLAQVVLKRRPLAV